MRHKYETRGIVLSRAPLGEANALITLLTPELGTVRARAQSVRRSGAKLAAALVTFAESDVTLVHGKEGWRISGAVLGKNWFDTLGAEARERAVRISGLLLRFVTGETPDPALFSIIAGAFEALATLPAEYREAAEMLAVLRILSALGFHAGDIPGQATDFGLATVASIREQRGEYLTRINRSIEAAEL